MKVFAKELPIVTTASSKGLEYYYRFVSDHTGSLQQCWFGDYGVFQLAGLVQLANVGYQMLLSQGWVSVFDFEKSY
jgi:hypothetical protein